MDAKLAKVYYSLQGCWKKLAVVVKVSEEAEALGPAVAGQASTLAGLPTRAALHSSAKV